MYRLGLVISVLAIACSKDKPAADKQPPPAAAKPDSTGPCAKAKPEGGALAWIEDDYPSALACAKQRDVPLVLDLWAPWCHTCLSMKTTVFTDPSFQQEAGGFVFVSIDTDKEPNAPVVAKFPLSAWPTFYVVGPDEAVLGRWVGSSSLAQFHQFLAAGTAARTKVDGAAKRLLASERALAAKDYVTASTELEAALTEAPADWPRRPDVWVSLISTAQRQEAWDRCFAIAKRGMDQTGSTASAGDFAATALACADEREKQQPDEVKAVRDLAIKRIEGLLAQADAQLSLDDRSDLMLTLRETYKAQNRLDEAKALAEKQRALLVDAAAKAPTPLAAATYNWHLAEVYVFLDRPLEAVPPLEASAKALPSEYDPRARLGWVYLHAGKYPEAVKWTDEALTMVYGPRKGRVLAQRAEIAAAMHDPEREKLYRQEAVKLWESLPPGQASPENLAKAKELLAKLDAPPAASN